MSGWVENCELQEEVEERDFRRTVGNRRELIDNFLSA